MSYKPHYIASYDDNSGLNTYYEPFLLPEKAYPILEDAYCWRGKTQRNPGYDLLGRLRRTVTKAAMGNISAAGAGTVTFNIFTGMGILATEPNAQILPGTVLDPITIIIGAPIGQTLTDTTGTGTLAIAPAGLITAASINYATEVLSLTFSGAAGVSAATVSMKYFPSLPVMGLRLQEQPAINNEDMIAFDTKYAYKYNQTTAGFEELVPGTTWTGTNSNFFFSTNYYNDATGPLFWATNTHMAGASNDPIRYYNTATWTNFVPIIGTTGANSSYLYNAEIILPYKDRLLFLNTWEDSAPVAAPNAGLAVNFPRRVRWSQNGTPLAADAFRSDIVGKGGYLDVPTPNEVIVGAEFIKDTLIVKFERSSWKLVYTGNEILPFVFQQINVELGSESKFSLVPFDRGVFSVANYGVTADDSVNVERIDVEIPNTVFQFQNTDEGTVRVHGIRNYYDEVVYWTYVYGSSNPVGEIVYPNRVLVYNYRNNSYGIFKDSFTCYGTFQYARPKTWAELTDFTWEQWNSTWDTGIFQALFPNIVAGTQHGFVEVLNQAQDSSGNDPSLFIKAIPTIGPTTLTIPDHNLQNDDIIYISGIVDDGGTSPSLLNNNTYLVSRIDKDTIGIKVFLGGVFTDPANVTPTPLITAANIYIGVGVVTKINKFNIVTKVFAPFYEQGSQCRLGYVDFLFDKTDNGEITSAVYIDENNTFSMTDSTINTALNGTQTINTKPDNLTLIPFQAFQEKIWHRQFVQSVAQNFQIQMTMTPEQNADLPIAESDFVMHAMAFYLSPNARLVQ